MAKMLNKRKFIVNAVITVFVTALTFLYLFKSGAVTVDAISAVKWQSYIFVFALFVGCLLLLAFIEKLIYSTFSEQMTFSKSVFNTAMGHLGSGITPFRSGHFPLMAYGQIKTGIKPTVTATGFVKCQIIYSATSIAVYAAFTVYLLISKIKIVVLDIEVYLWTVVLIGLAVHASIFTALILLSFSDRIKNGALKLFCKIIKKFKKSFDVDKFYYEKSLKLIEFKEQISVIGRAFYKYIPVILLYVLYMILSGSMQYFAYLSITGELFDFSVLFTFYSLNITAAYIGNVIPLPGGAGTSEALFILIFSNVLGDLVLGQTLVLWRVCTYYAPVVLEFTAFIVIAVFAKKAKSE